MASAKAEREEREKRALKERKEAIDAARCAFVRFIAVRSCVLPVHEKLVLVACLKALYLFLKTIGLAKVSRG